MRLYLSSFRMGDHPEHLTALAGPAARTAVVIANAMDGAPHEVRRNAVGLELTALADLGFTARELDLRDYFGAAGEQRLRGDLSRAAVTWLRGGNTFVLRHALARSGGDVVFRDLLAAGANIVAVGQLGPHGVLTASIVTEPSVVRIELAGGPAKIRPSGCSADAITTAAILAGG